jgi:hypothetical protein
MFHQIKLSLTEHNRRKPTPTKMRIAGPVVDVIAIHGLEQPYATQCYWLATYPQWRHELHYSAI